MADSGGRRLTRVVPALERGDQRRCSELADGIEIKVDRPPPPSRPPVRQASGTSLRARQPPWLGTQASAGGDHDRCPRIDNVMIMSRTAPPELQPRSPEERRIAPEQPTDPPIVHHPEAKYFSA
jgi:hypothetical protein